MNEDQHTCVIYTGQAQQCDKLTQLFVTFPTVLCCKTTALGRQTAAPRVVTGFRISGQQKQSFVVVAFLSQAGQVARQCHVFMQVSVGPRDMYVHMHRVYWCNGAVVQLVQWCDATD